MPSLHAGAASVPRSVNREGGIVLNPAGVAVTPAPESALPPPAAQSHWLGVLCLIGVDYFSSLAYQPSITYSVAGPFGPLATLFIVLVTFLGAVPVYAFIARESPHGQGAITLLERLVRGWAGKTLVLIVLGLAVTDFTVTKSLSLADASEHILRHEAGVWRGMVDSLVALHKDTAENLLGPEAAWYFNCQVVTTILLGLIGYLLWALLKNGFGRKAVALSVVIVAVYMTLTAVVLVSGSIYVLARPELIDGWRAAAEEHARTAAGGSSPWRLLALSAVLFPSLALGLSGFEMSMVAMPQVRGAPDDDPERPRARIRNTRRILVISAAILCAYLLLAVLVTTILVPAGALLAGGAAEHRALAYLAHGGALTTGEGARALNPIFGPVFGAVYDLATVAILCMAGLNVAVAVRTLVPKLLLRFGMELRWVDRRGALIALFALVNVIVTLYFRASVEAQRGAYATAVLALMTNAALASALTLWRRRSGRRWALRMPWAFGAITCVFGAATILVIARTPGGILIACGFIAAILGTSVLSRSIRVREYRTTGFEFVDEASRALWEKLKALDFPVLVPHRPGLRSRSAKAQSIRGEHQLAPDVEVVILEIEIDDPSDFYQDVLVRVSKEDGFYVIQVTRCASIAHAIAATALEMSRYSRPPALHFGWSEMSLVGAMWSYLVFGEGNVPWRVKEIIERQEPDPARRPRVIVG